MKQNVTEHDFVRAFDDYNRSDAFSREARFALYDYIIELEEDIGEEIELDVISICCAFSEYSNLAELNEDYGNTIEADCWKDYDEVREDFAWFVDIPNSDGFLVAEAW